MSFAGCDVKHGITRRRLLLAGAGSVSAVVVARMLLGSWRLQRREQPRSVRSASTVALVACDSYARQAIRPALERGLALAPPPDVHGKSVLLKPNFVEYSPDRPVTTHVELIRECVRIFRDLGARQVVIGEGPGHNPDTDDVWHRSGLVRAAAAEGAPLVDLNIDDLVLTRMHTFAPGPSFPGRELEYLFLPKTVVSADLVVSMPKLKTHHWAGFTLAMKNLFGIVPSVKYGWPKNILHVNGIQRSIVELTASVQPGYTIADGVVGMEGDGPIMGSPVDSHCLIFGRTPYTVDWVGAKLIGLDPAQVDVIRLASATGLGAMEDPPIVGEPIAALKRTFAIPPRFDPLRS